MVRVYVQSVLVSALIRNPHHDTRFSHNNLPGYLWHLVQLQQLHKMDDAISSFKREESDWFTIVIPNWKGCRMSMLECVCVCALFRGRLTVRCLAASVYGTGNIWWLLLYVPGVDIWHVRLFVSFSFFSSPYLITSVILQHSHDSEMHTCLLNNIFSLQCFGRRLHDWGWLDDLYIRSVCFSPGRDGK